MAPINLKQLLAFREVMLTGSVSEAARNLHRTQPAVSAQIASLEEKVELKLFARRDGRLHPLPEAQYLLAEATEILDRLNNVQRTLASVRNLESGTIHIIAMPGPSVFLLPDLISRFVDGREDIHVSLITRSSFQAQQLLSAQRYDIGLIDMNPGEAPASSLMDHDILDYRCLCAVPASDPLADLKAVTAKHLDGKPVATLYEDHPTCRQIRAIFDKQDLTLKRRFESQYFIPLMTFVERQQAYAIVDPLSVESYRLYRGDRAGVVFRPFVPAVDFAVSLVTPSHRPLSNLAKTFIAYLKDALQGLQAASDRQTAAGD